MDMEDQKWMYKQERKHQNKQFEREMEITDRELIEFTSQEEFNRFRQAPKINSQHIMFTDFDQLAMELQQ